MQALIVFDLDGTLVDSRRDLADAANALVRELGGSPLPEAQVGDMVGEGAAVLVRRVLTAAGLNPEQPGALARFLELYDERLLEHTQPYDGILETLDTLRERSMLAVLTNKPQAATDKLLAGLGLTPYFKDVIGGDTPFGRKPDPVALHEIGRRSNAAMTSTTLVGDSPVDLATARNAGCRIVLVRYGFGFREVEVRNGERVVSHPLELAALLAP